MIDDKAPELLLGEMCAKALEELDGANLKRAQLLVETESEDGTAEHLCYYGLDGMSWTEHIGLSERLKLMFQVDCMGGLTGDDDD